MPFGTKYAVKSIMNKEECIRTAKSSAAPWVAGQLVSDYRNLDTVAVQMGAITSTQ